MPAKDKVLYLTFDDGPMPGPTEYVLDILRERNAKGTFFCIGDNVRKYPDIFRRLVEEGHAIGNHTFNHLNGWRTPTDAYVSNAAAFDEVAASVGFSTPVRLFRPPYGKITPRQIRAMKAYRIVMWDVLTRDYDERLSPEKCLRGSVQACRPGSVIVFHDSHKSYERLHYALPRLMDHFAERGYTFAPIPDTAS